MTDAWLEAGRCLLRVGWRYVVVSITLYLLGVCAPAEAGYEPVVFDEVHPAKASAAHVTNGGAGTGGTICSGDGLDLLVPFDPSDGTWTNSFGGSGRNDDGSVGPLTLPFDFDLYGSTYDRIYINNNGNLTFGVRFSAFTAAGFPDASIPPMLAPFWGDVDTRSTAAGGVVWHKFIGNNAMVVTWDNVGYFNRQTDRLNTFQVVLTDGTSDIVGIGRNVAFSYSEMCWTTGSASGGSGGFGGTPATVGVNAGDGENFFQIGRFSRNNADYDGPYGQSDGVDYLDYELVVADVSQSNVPPVPTGFPDDGVFIVEVGGTPGFLQSVVAFLSPEEDQTTSIEVQDLDSAADLGFSFVSTPGNTATVELDWTPSCCDQGLYRLVFVATDSADGITTFEATIDVRCVDRRPVADAGGPYVFECQGPLTSGLLSALDSLDPDTPSASLMYAWSSDCPGVSFDDPSSPTPMVTLDSSQLAGAGCSASCSVTVTVSDGVCQDAATADITLRDTMLPVIMPPSPIEVIGEVSGGGISALVAVEPPAVTDACDVGPSLVGARDDGQPLSERYPVGTTQIIWTATDQCQQATQVEQEVVVLPPPLPNLVVTAIEAPATASEFDQVLVTWTVTNAGDAPASGIWRDDVRLSDDDVVGGDVAVDAVDFAGSLAPGESYTRERTVQLPAGLVGLQRVVIVTDAGSSVVEYLGEADNATIDDRPLDVLLPQLVPTAAAGPSTAQINRGFEVSFEVQNQGSGAANRVWQDRLYLSADEVFSADDLLVGSRSSPVPPLPAGAGYSRIVQATATVDAGAIPGLYWLLLRVDDGGAQPESNELDNVRVVGPLELSTPPAPDLLALDVGVPASGEVGSQVAISWRVANLGDAGTETSWTDRVYLSSDQSLDPGDRLLDEFGNPAVLVPGGEYTRSVGVELAGEPGQYHVLVQTDAEGTVDEVFGEGNNVAVSLSTIEVRPRPRPDLVVAAVTPPSSGVFSGSSPEITVRVRNAGTGATESPHWSDRVYLSLDDRLDGGDRVLVTAPNPLFLLPGEEYEQRLSPTLPEDIEGTYYLIVHTDVNSEETELDESNNVLASNPFDIALEPQPDLQVASVTAPDTAFAGDVISVGWVEINSDALPGTGGATDASAWTTDVYLSSNPDPAIGAGDTRLLRTTSTGLLGPSESRPLSRSIPLPPVLSGQWYLKVRVDVFNAVSEFGFEGNNVGVLATPISVIQPPPVDLVPMFVEGIGSTQPGGRLLVSWGGENFGAPPGVAESWLDGLYLSGDQVLDDGDILLGRVSRGTTIDPDGLPAIEPYTDSSDFTVPGALPPGSYFVVVRIDDRGDVYEGNFEDNNVLASAQPIVVEDRYADLAVSPADPVPSIVFAGEQVDVAWEVVNDGEIPTHPGGWRDRVYFQGVDGSGRVILTTRTTSTQLGVGQSYKRTAPIQIPLVPPGSYLIQFVTDIDDSVIERPAGELNNTAEIELTVSGDGPNLVPDLGDLPSEFTAGGSFQVDWEVANLGNQPTSATSWVDRVIVVDQNGVERVAAVRPRTGSLGLSESYQGSAVVSIPSSDAGLFTIAVVADATNTVFEQSESDNRVEWELLVVRGPQPNLVARAVEAPGVGAAGAALSVSWTVGNEGESAVPEPRWSDRVWLSRDRLLGPDDLVLLTESIELPLPVGQEYMRHASPIVPADAIGDYFLLLRTDALAGVFEDGREIDNTVSSVSPVGIEGPDLVAELVEGPPQGVAGQPIDVSWSVRNDGATTTRGWRDTVYLSRDRFISGNDTALGGVNRSGGLAGGDSYTASAAVTLPTGRSGPFFLLLATDSLNAVPEQGDDSFNVVSSDLPINLILPEPADIVVDAVNVPSGVLTLGDTAEFSWVLGNAADSPADLSGVWSNSVFLSEDDVWDVSDRLVARIDSDTGGPVAPGDTFAVSGFADIPGVTPGDYHVIVRADTLNVIPETDESNNIGVSSGVVTVDAEPLTLGVPKQTDLPGGRSRWYRVDVAAGDAIRFSLDHNSPAAWTELYVKRGSVPTTGDFDFIFDNPGDPDQQVLIPAAEGGTYYILVRATRGGGTDDSATVLAEAIPFGIAAVTPSVVGNAGSATVRVRGARFDQFTKFTLENGDRSVEANWVRFRDNSTVDLTFDLNRVPTGVWDLRAVSQDRFADVNETTEEIEEFDVVFGESFFPGAVEVVPGGGPSLQTFMLTPPSIRVGTVFEFIAEVRNTGLNDAMAPVVLFDSPSGFQISTSPTASFVGGSQQQMVVLGKRRPTRLGPGEGVLIRLYARSTQVGPGSVRLNLFSDVGGAVDWNRLESYYRDDSPDVVWEQTWENFLGLVGQTWGDLHNAMRLSASDANFDAGERIVLGSEIMQDLLIRAQSGQNTAGVFFSEQSPFFDESFNFANLGTLFGNAEFPRGGEPDNWCQPYSNPGAAILALSWVQSMFNVLDPLGTGGVWRQYLSNTDGNYPVNSYGETDTIGRAFRDSPEISRAERGTVKSTLKNWARSKVTEIVQANGNCDSISTSEQAPTSFRLDDPASGLTQMQRRVDINFNRPFSIPGNLAGGVGAGGPNNSFPDFREFTGSVDIWRTVDDCGRTTGIRAKANLFWLVFDTVDFCSGDPGAGFEQIYTIPLSRLEATEPVVWDVGISVFFATDPFSLGSVNVPQVCRESDCDEQPPAPECAGDDDPDPCCPAGNSSGGADCDGDEENDVNVVGAVDPNEKASPSGFGEQRWLSASASIPYRIYFENLPDATAPAALVTIEDVLTDTLAPGSLRLGDIRFGETVVEVPDNRISYTTDVETTSAQGNPLLLRIQAGVDASGAAPRAFWTLQAIDPATGEPPLDPFDGFLPPNDENGIGEGYVDFTIRAAPGVLTGTVIENGASIVFDNNEPIITNTVMNTIDATRPVSSLGGAPQISDDGRIPLAFEAQDPAGAGLAEVSVLVSVDGGTYEAFASEPAGGVTEYIAAGPGLYAFAAQAKDNAGNIESLPPLPDALVAVPGLSLEANSDTGVSGDGVTANNTPAFELISLPGLSVPVSISGPGVDIQASVLIGVDGRTVYQPEEPLPDGQYLVSSDHSGIERTVDLTIDTTGPGVDAWQSLALHTNAGALPINAVNGQVTEPRAGGASRVSALFSEPVDAELIEASVTGIDADGQPIDLGSTSVGVLGAGDTAIELVFDPPLAGPALYCLELTGPGDPAGNPLNAETTRLTIAVLLADVTSDRRVNATDIGFVRGIADQTAGNPIDPSDAQQIAADIDRNGQVTSADVDAARAARGEDLRFLVSPCDIQALSDLDAFGGSLGHGQRSMSPVATTRSDGTPEEQAQANDPVSLWGEWLEFIDPVGEDGGSPRVRADFLPADVIIRLTPDRIALHAPDNGPALANALQSIGVPADQVRPWIADNWWTVPVAALAKDAIGSLTLAGLDVSPIFIDQDGGEFVVPPTLILEPEAGATPVPPVPTASMPAVRHRGAYLDATFDRVHGAQVWAMANSVARSGTGWAAEPDVIAEVVLTAASDRGRLAVPESPTTSRSPRDAAIAVIMLDDAVEYWRPELRSVPGLDLTSVNSLGSADAQDAAPRHGAAMHGTPVASGIASAIDAYDRTSTPRIYPIAVVSVHPDSQRSVTRLSGLLEAVGAASRSSGRVLHFGFTMGYPSAAVGRCLDRAHQSGLAIVAPVGHFRVRPAFPASHHAVLSVAGLDADNRPAPFCAAIRGADLYAGAVDLWLADLTGPAGFAEGDHAHLSGVSFASATVAGALAAIAMEYPAAGPDELTDLLRASCSMLSQPNRAGEPATFGRLDHDRLQAVLARSPDLNHDGDLDATDIEMFIEMLRKGHARGDLNRDGLVDVSDSALILEGMTDPVPLDAKD